MGVIIPLVDVVVPPPVPPAVGVVAVAVAVAVAAVATPPFWRLIVCDQKLSLLEDFSQITETSI